MRRVILLFCLIILTVKSFAVTKDASESYRMACETVGSDSGEIVSVDTVITKRDDHFEIESDIYSGEKCFESEVVKETRSLWKVISQSNVDFTASEVNDPSNSQYTFVISNNPYVSSSWGSSYEASPSEEPLDQYNFQLVKYEGGASLIFPEEQMKLFRIED